jgi:regulator of sigma E protease
MTPQPPEESVQTANAHADEVRTPQEKRRVFIMWIVALLAIAVFSSRRPDIAFALFMFALTLSVLVFVHEWGHYQFALWAGMRVKRFAVGFPPFIFTKRRNGIDYSIGALPIGGMVDIAGLGSEEEMVAQAKGEPSTHMALPSDVPAGRKNYQDASLGWRFLTLFAGPLMNFIFAMFVFVAFYTFIGEPTKEVVTNTVDLVDSYTPAFRAGVQSDDKIIGVNNLRSDQPEQLIKAIRGSNGKPVKLYIERAGQVLPLTLTPQLEDIADDKTTKPVPVIGIRFLPQYSEFQTTGVFVGKNGFSDSAIGKGLLTSAAQAQQIFGLLRRVVTVQMTPQDKRSVGGPVKIAQAVNHSARRAWWQWIVTAGALSLNLGIMNLLPIPALDGGRIMFILYEAVTRRPFDQRKEGLVNAIGMAMVLTFMLFMTFRDVLPFIQKSLQ